MEEIAERVARYLGHHMPHVEGLEVADVRRFHGGASRETYRMTIRYRKGGEPVERGIVLRRDPASTLIETERQVEFAAYRAFHGTPVPVPEPLYLELDESWLERPFFMMEEVPAGEPGSPFDADPYGERRETVGRQFWEILGRIHAHDPSPLGLAEVMEAPAPDACWRRELDYWESVIDADELEPQPIARAAIRHLRGNPPPAAQRVTTVHGDYRNGNFLADADGRVRAVLDWEMSHLGDPVEDLGWGLDPLWSGGDPQRPGGMIDRDEALRIWESASGLRADPEALMWWETFAHVKGLAIWISSAREFHDGSNEDPVLAISAWFCTQAHNRILAARMAALRDARRKA